MIVYVLMLLFGRRYCICCMCVLLFFRITFCTFAYSRETLNFAQIINVQCSIQCAQKRANFYAHDIFRHVTCHCNAKMIYSNLIIAYPFMCFLHVRTFINVFENLERECVFSKNQLNICVGIVNDVVWLWRCWFCFGLFFFFCGTYTSWQMH